MIIATKHVTRRNSFIIMISLALGVGVALEPNLFEGGGVASFYGQNLHVRERQRPLLQPLQ